MEESLISMLKMKEYKNIRTFLWLQKVMLPVSYEHRTTLHISIFISARRIQ